MWWQTPSHDDSQSADMTTLCLTSGLSTSG
jgi:hypothetical protein